MRNKWSVSVWYRLDAGTYTNLRIERTRFRQYWIAKLYHIIMKLLQYDTYISYIPLYSIDTDSGVSYQDSGRWRSYQLDTSGDTIEELIQNATVSEIDQDGGDLDTYSLDEAPSNVEKACLKIIHREVSK